MKKLTKCEALKKIDELKEYIKELDSKNGFNDLTIEEIKEIPLDQLRILANENGIFKLDSKKFNCIAARLRKLPVSEMCKKNTNLNVYAPEPRKQKE